MYDCCVALCCARFGRAPAYYCPIESDGLPIRTAELLQTKLQRLGVTRELVPRPRLIERLNRAASDPLTLVCAPAGFGKSTLVSSWIEGMTAGTGGDTGGVTPPLRAAWLSLDENDSDLILFLRYFVAALRTIPRSVHRVGRDAGGAAGNAFRCDCSHAQQRDCPPA